MYEVSTLSKDSLPELYQLGHAFFKEGKLPGEFIESEFIKTWNTLMDLGVGTIFSLRKDGELKGGLGAIKYPDANDGKCVVTEAFWYVLAEARGHGLALLKAFERWAVDVGAERIIMVHLSGLTPEPLKKLYLRMGYDECEVHYVKKIT